MVGPGSTSSRPSMFKRGAFTNAAWAKPDTDGEEDDFFSGSKRTLSLLAAEKKKRRQNEEESPLVDGKDPNVAAEDGAVTENDHTRGGKRDEKFGNKEVVESKATPEPRQAKRPRLSFVDDPDIHPKSSSQASAMSPSKRDVVVGNTEREASSITSDYENEVGSYLGSSADESETETNRPETASSYPKDSEISPVKSQSTTLLSPGVNSEEDFDGIEFIGSQSVPSKPNDDLDLELSDDELPELARKAKEEALLETSSAKSPQAGGNNTANLSSEILQAGQGSERSLPVKLWIHSEISDTKDLAITVNLNQRLREARRYWCRYHNFDFEKEKSIVLIFNGMRIYDSTTCQGLGFDVGEDGLATRSKDRAMESYEYIRLEAMTEGEYEGGMNLNNEENAGTKTASEIVDQTTQSTTTESKLKVILRAKDYPPLKLLVNPSDKFRKLANAFRQANHIGDYKEVQCFYDGEEINDTQTIEELEVANKDTIDVYVK